MLVWLQICIAKKQITELWETRWVLGCETERVRVNSYFK